MSDKETTRGKRYGINEPAWRMSVRHVEELNELHGGDVKMVLASIVEEQIAVLSSIYRGNEFAIADHLEAVALAVGASLREQAIPLARGTRH